MSPCMCGDTECPSCGVAQGTTQPAYLDEHVSLTHEQVDEVTAHMEAHPTTFHEDGELDLFRTMYPHLKTWVVQRWRLACYAPRQHSHCVERCRRWADEIRSGDE